MAAGEVGPVREWAASGAMALTGAPDGMPLVAPGDPAGQVRRGLDRFAELTARRTGSAPDLPGAELLGERAAIAGIGRNAPWSCGGAFKAVQTADGWIGLSLPRASDRSLVPALVETDCGNDPWTAVAEWAARRSSLEVIERLALLGLAGAALPAPGEASSDRDAVTRTASGPRRHRRDRPLVVDLTSLWAGPLCAHLLGLGGADVVKIESRSRPDGARRGPRAFFDLLHAGHRMVALDLSDPVDIASLHALVAQADLVLEASRSRAMLQLGIDAEAVVAAGTSWLSITARGRAVNVVGFGDDVAAGAGLTVDHHGTPVPCGDAIADPLAGVAAAEASAEALLDDRAQLIDVSMHDVAAAAARGGVHTPVVTMRDGVPWVVGADGDARVADPRARTPGGRAGDLGADNAGVLG